MKRQSNATYAVRREDKNGGAKFTLEQVTKAQRGVEV
jgi:hypothetical protein